MELGNWVFVAMVTTFPREQNFCNFCFAHGIHQPNLNFKAKMIPELLELWYQNAAIIPQNLVFKYNVEKRE